MIKYKDYFGVERGIEFAPCFMKGWVNLTVHTPNRNSSNTYMMPVAQLDELIEQMKNLQKGLKQNDK